MKIILLTCALLFSVCNQSFAAELSPENLVGRYKVSAAVAMQKVYLNFRVLDKQEFEIQRVYPSGKQDEICNGTYTMNRIFNGVFTCPSNRSKSIDFNIDFKNRTTEDLTKGTTVVVQSSLAPGYLINAHIKKQ